MRGDWSAEGGNRIERDPAGHQLLLRAKAGERDALEELCRNSWGPIYRFLAQRCDSAAEAEDMTQSVFLRALTSLADFEDRGIPFEAYLFRTARNLLVDRWRSSSHTTISLTALSDDSTLLQMPTVADAIEDRHELTRAFIRLSADHQQILRMRLVEGRTSAEVATLIGSTAPAVRQMQVRAVSALRAAMEGPRQQPVSETTKRKDLTP
jgi:RNA polymerase sigma-70 factor (ECF subfamily)